MSALTTRGTYGNPLELLPELHLVQRPQLVRPVLTRICMLYDVGDMMVSDEMDTFYFSVTRALCIHIARGMMLVVIS